MKRTVVAITAAAILLFGFTGCGTQERDELRAQVASLQQQLTKANSDLAVNETELSSLRGDLQAAQSAQAQLQSQLDSLTAELKRAKADLAKAKGGTKNAKKTKNSKTTKNSKLTKKEK